MAVCGNYFVATTWKLKLHENENERKRKSQDLLLVYSTIVELLLFLTVPIFIEMVLPVWTCVTVYLMILFAVYALEGVGTGLTLLCLEPQKIGFQVFFATLCLLLVVLRFVRSIAFDTSGSMCSACYSQVSPLLVVLALRDSKIHVGTTYSGNKVSNVKTTVDDWLSFGTVLWVSDINLYYSWVRFGWSLNNVRLRHENDVIEYMSFFDYSFN